MEFLQNEVIDGIDKELHKETPKLSWQTPTLFILDTGNVKGGLGVGEDGAMLGS